MGKDALDGFFERGVAVTEGFFDDLFVGIVTDFAAKESICSVVWGGGVSAAENQSGEGEVCCVGDDGGADC